MKKVISNEKESAHRAESARRAPGAPCLCGFSSLGGQNEVSSLYLSRKTGAMEKLPAKLCCRSSRQEETRETTLYLFLER